MTGSHEPTTPPTVPPPPPPTPPGQSVSAPSGPSDRPSEGPSNGASGIPSDPPPVAGPSAPPAEVPDLDDRDRELDPRVVTVWRFSTVISLLPPSVLLSGLAVAFLDRTIGLVVAAVLLVLIVVVTAWYPGARYARWRWRLTDLAVELEHGVVVRQAEALPYFRIQQIDVNQGPIDRLLGLASLQVTSASASGSVTLPGITATEAPGVRRALLARAAAAIGGQDAGVRDAV